MALFELKTNKTLDNTYSSKLQVPQYEPKSIKPNVMSLYNCSKYSKLIRDIENSDISEEDKKFLKLAASRHIVFNYSQIADYYANSSKEVQKLMEDSALVIIDINDAIRDGYVRLSKTIKDICDNDKNAKKLGRAAKSDSSTEGV